MSPEQLERSRITKRISERVKHQSLNKPIDTVRLMARNKIVANALATLVHGHLGGVGVTLAELDLWEWYIVSDVLGVLVCAEICFSGEMVLTMKRRRSGKAPQPLQGMLLLPYGASEFVSYDTRQMGGQSTLFSASGSTPEEMIFDSLDQALGWLIERPPMEFL